jgi:peptidoglycan/xylan/chitin deacetylase (PgdA/CDA1 family)
MTSTPSKGFEWPDGYRAAALVTIDFDAESGILHTDPQVAGYLDVMAHQAYGARTGVARLLEILDRKGVRATFFIPGFSAERWPDVVCNIRDAGHEIAHHGFLHESIHGVDEPTEEGYLLRGLQALEQVAGVRPVGFRSPGFKMNRRTPGLLARHGFQYDSSLQDSDWPYHLAASCEPDAPSVVELPVQWALDDWAHYMYLPGLRPVKTIADPSTVLNMWSLELEATADAGGCFTLTIHPFLSGRPSRARALEELLSRMQETDGLWIPTGSEVAAHAVENGADRVWHRPVELAQYDCASNATDMNGRVARRLPAVSES